jgi:hypothetical protein
MYLLCKRGKNVRLIGWKIGIMKSWSIVDRGGDNVTVVIVDVSPRHLFHVYIASFLRSLIYTRVLLLSVLLSIFNISMRPY